MDLAVRYTIYPDGLAAGINCVSCLQPLSSNRSHAQLPTSLPYSYAFYFPKT